MIPQPIDLVADRRRRLAAVLRMLAAARPLRGQEVAARAGLDPSYVSLLFNEKRSPGPDTIAALARVFSITPEFLRALAESNPSDATCAMFFLVLMRPNGSAEDLPQRGAKSTERLNIIVDC